MSQASQAFGALWPAMAIAAVCMLAAWPPWRRPGPLWRGNLGSALALGLGFLASFTAVVGPKALQLSERWMWIGPIAVAALAVGVLASVLQWRGAGRLVLGAVAAASAGALLHVLPSIANPRLWQAGLAVVAFALWLVLEPLADRRTGAALPLALTMIFASVAVVLLESRNATFSLLAAALWASCGIATVAAWFNPSVSLAHGALHVATPLLAALLVTGKFYDRADLPLASFVLPMIAVPMLWLGEIGWVARRQRFTAALIRVALALAAPAAAAAVALATTGEV